MPKRIIVFVGDLRTLYDLSGFLYYFNRHGWKSVSCESIEEAQSYHPTALVVWVLDGHYVIPVNNWKNRPITVWYEFGPRRAQPPEGVIFAKTATLPSQINRMISEQLALLKQTHG